ncbi:MAG: hypothetical protein ACJATO_002465, partial [Arenicella sp.]
SGNIQVTLISLLFTGVLSFNFKFNSKLNLPVVA